MPSSMLSKNSSGGEAQSECAQRKKSRPVSQLTFAGRVLLYARVHECNFSGTA